jgi:hypothetical protein
VVVSGGESEVDFFQGKIKFGWSAPALLGVFVYASKDCFIKPGRDTGDEYPRRYWVLLVVLLPEVFW